MLCYKHVLRYIVSDLQSTNKCLFSTFAPRHVRQRKRATARCETTNLLTLFQLLCFLENVSARPSEPENRSQRAPARHVTGLGWPVERWSELQRGSPGSALARSLDHSTLLGWTERLVARTPYTLIKTYGPTISSKTMNCVEGGCLGV